MIISNINTYESLGTVELDSQTIGKLLHGFIKLTKVSFELPEPVEITIGDTFDIECPGLGLGKFTVVITDIRQYIIATPEVKEIVERGAPHIDVKFDDSTCTEIYLSHGNVFELAHYGEITSFVKVS